MPAAVGAEVEAQKAVAVLHPRVVADDARRDEFVRLALRVTRRNGRLGIGLVLALSMHHGVEGLRHALPSLVPVHGVVAPAHGSDLSLRRERGFQGPDILGAGLRGRVAPVGEDVDHRRDPVPGQHLREGDGMVLVGVDAAGRDQPEEVAGAAGLPQLCDETGLIKRGRDAPVRDGLIDAGEVLHDHAAGAQVQMPHLGVAHLALGKADIEPGGAEEGMRRARPQPVEIRRLGLQDRIVLRVLAPAPAIENYQHRRAPGGHCEAFAARGSGMWGDQ
jgi:hypothetical protein